VFAGQGRLLRSVIDKAGRVFRLIGVSLRRNPYSLAWRNRQQQDLGRDDRARHVPI